MAALVMQAHQRPRSSIKRRPRLSLTRAIQDRFLLSICCRPRRTRLKVWPQAPSSTIAVTKEHTSTLVRNLKVDQARLERAPSRQPKWKVQESQMQLLEPQCSWQETQIRRQVLLTLDLVQRRAATESHKAPLALTCTKVVQHQFKRSQLIKRAQPSRLIYPKWSMVTMTTRFLISNRLKRWWELPMWAICSAWLCKVSRLKTIDRLPLPIASAKLLKPSSTIRARSEPTNLTMEHQEALWKAHIIFWVQDRPPRGNKALLRAADKTLIPVCSSMMCQLHHLRLVLCCLSKRKAPQSIITVKASKPPKRLKSSRKLS